MNDHDAEYRRAFNAQEERLARTRKLVASIETAAEAEVTIRLLASKHGISAVTWTREDTETLVINDATDAWPDELAELLIKSLTGAVHDSATGHLECTGNDAMATKVEAVVSAALAPLLDEGNTFTLQVTDTEGDTVTFTGFPRAQAALSFAREELSNGSIAEAITDLGGEDGPVTVQANLTGPGARAVAVKLFAITPDGHRAAAHTLTLDPAA